MYRKRIIMTLLIVLAALAIPASQVQLPAVLNTPEPQTEATTSQRQSSIAELLGTLAVKGRAPKTGYARAQFGNGWATSGGCDTRNVILARDLSGEELDDKCRVLAGTLNDPYTGTTIQFQRGADTSALVQIDHVVALSNAWQTGAQQLTVAQREAFANDPLNLLAVDGQVNQDKSDGDAATWLPPNKPFRCQYVERQVKVKQKYSLWVTSAEKAAIERVATNC